jgi:N-acetylneuraminic acid mutarotase
MRAVSVLLGVAVCLSLAVQPTSISSDAAPQTGMAERVKLYYGAYGSNDFVWGTASDALPTPDAWQYHSEMPSRMMDNVAATDGDHVYVAAGYTVGRVLYRHAVGSTAWETMAQCPLPLTTGGAAIIGDTFYYCGGYDSMNTAADTLLKYSISGNDWTSAPGPYSGSGNNWSPTVVACEGKLYFCSGCSSPGATNPTTQVWCYTPGAGWAQVASMNQGRVFANAVSYNDTIWVAGGNSNDVELTHTEFYDPVADTWVVDNSVFPQLPRGRWGSACGVASDVMFVASGVSPSGALSDTIFEFSFVSRTWSTQAGMLLKVYRTAGCGTPDGKAMVYGGSTVGFTPTDTVQFQSYAPPVANDVGADQVLAPLGTVLPVPVAPKVRLRNFGTNPQTNIPLTCWIDSAGTNVFTDVTTYADTLDPMTTVDVTFPGTWTGADGITYQVTMFTSLPEDSNYANDTAYASVTVQAAVWETIPKPPTQVDRIVHATVYNPVNDKIYMIGGNPAGMSGTYLNLCQEYDPAARTWATKAPMPTPLGWLAGSCCDGKIYIVGGHDNSNQGVATNRCFDPVANSWSTLTPRPRNGYAAAEVVWRDSLIYVLGGKTPAAGFANVDIYDPATDAWSVGTALPAVGYMSSAAIIEDTIFMVQAYNGSSCWSNLYKGVIDTADATQIAWTAGPVPTEPVFNGGTAALNGNVYWLGGYANAATATNHVWKYSTSTGAITAFTPDYPVTLARCNFMVARPSAQELYVLAGDELGDWNAPNQRYYRICFGPPGVEELRAELGGSIDNVMPTLVRDCARINFTIVRPGKVSLGVYDATGSLVRTLVRGPVEPGSQSAVWNRTDNSGRRVANGTYFYRLTADGRSVSGKAIVLQ